MSSPACSISLDDEETRELAELKARHDAEMREAVERKAHKDQEWRERRDREKRERKEREEREEREAQEVAETTCRLRDAYSAAAGKAQERAEAEARAENEKIREALHRMQEAGEGDGSESSGPSENNTKEVSGEDLAPSTKRLTRKVVRS